MPRATLSSTLSTSSPAPLSGRWSRSSLSLAIPRADAHMGAAYNSTDSHTLEYNLLAESVGPFTLGRRLLIATTIIARLLQVRGVSPGIIRCHPQIFNNFFYVDLSTTYVQVKNLRDAFPSQQNNFDLLRRQPKTRVFTPIGDHFDQSTDPVPDLMCLPYRDDQGQVIRERDRIHILNRFQCL